MSPSLSSGDRPGVGRLARRKATKTNDPEQNVEGLAFDRALAELQETVRRLEEGGLPLEEAIALYERGVALHERCARLLTDAELRVQRLVERGGGQVAVIEAGEPESAD